MFNAMTSKIFLIIGGALGIIIALLVFQNGRLEAKLDKSRLEVSEERAAHSVTLASLDRLEDAQRAIIAAANERSIAAEKALEKQKAVSGEIDRQIERLRLERAAAANSGVCETPKSILEASGL